MPNKQLIKTYSDIFSSDMVRFYRDRPVKFVEDIIFNVQAKKNGGEYEITSQQEEFLNSVAQHKRTACRSGHGCGKSSGFAWLILWFLCTRPHPLVPCTAPAFKQLNDVLWPEIARWLRISVVKDIFTWTNDRVYLTEHPKTWFATARTASTPENMQGLHNKHMLILMDEASGIMDEIYEVVRGALTSPDNRMAIAGNPTQTTGFFYNAFHKEAPYWNNLHFSSADSPIVEQDYVKSMADTWGVDHPVYLVRVLGDFPPGTPDSLIKLEHVEAAVMRDVKPSGNIFVGFDVARYGDDLSVVCWRQGNKVHPLKTMASGSIPDNTGFLLHSISEIRKETGYEGRIRVCVDADGLGAGVYDELTLDRDHNIDPIACTFGGKKDADYENEGSKMWDYIAKNIGSMDLPDDEHLIAELSSRRYKITQNGRIRIEAKADYKKDFHHSPDRADAFVLCFSDKQSDRLVLAGFDPLDETTIRAPEYSLSYQKFCSIFYSQSMLASIIWAKWGFGKLHIMEEFVGDEPLSLISAKINTRGPYQWLIGNEHMFTKATDNIAVKFRQYKTYLRQSLRYDEYGAIQFLKQLVADKTITVDSKCSKLLQQMHSWKYDTNRKELEDQFGLCYALCYLSAELRKMYAKPQTQPLYGPYSSEKNEALKMPMTYGRLKNYRKSLSL